MKILALIGALGIVAALAAAVFLFGGFYSVAATSDDPGIVSWALIKVRQASVDSHARGVSPPAVLLDDPATVRVGARAFLERGCATCHGAPGVEWAKFSEGLRPDPPDLKDVVKERKPEQLFWVIKNGINMTGMPGFSMASVDDKEIWTIVAFIRKLPSVSEADFKTWSAPAPGGSR